MMRIEIIAENSISHQARTYAEYRVFAALTESTEADKVGRVRVHLRPQLEGAAAVASPAQ